MGFHLEMRHIIDEGYAQMVKFTVVVGQVYIIPELGPGAQCQQEKYEKQNPTGISFVPQ
jgi:hypothetical protein